MECEKEISVEVMKKMSQKSRDEKRQKEEKKKEGKAIEEMLDDLLSLECSIFATWVLKVSSDSARQLCRGSWFHCITGLGKKETRV